MTDRDKLIEAMARGIDHALVWEVESDTRAGELTQREQRAVAQAALAAIEANGFAVVPVEPSAAQIAAGWRYAFQQSAQCYRAMIAAAPMQGDAPEREPNPTKSPKPQKMHPNGNHLGRII
jgi:hypothetical protein